MSTPDERHYLRLFTDNPQMQDNFLVSLLSMRSFYEIESDGAVVNALEVVIGAFTETFTEWENERSVAFGGVQEVLEAQRENDESQSS
jgi:hypothetical protein